MLTWIEQTCRNLDGENGVVISYFNERRDNPIKLSQGANKGKLLHQFKITLDGEEFEIDLRGTDDDSSLIDDTKSRDFSLNSIIFYRDSEANENFFLTLSNVSYSLNFSICLKIRKFKF